MSNKPGWYPIPNENGMMDYWDGNKWAGAKKPIVPDSPAPGDAPLSNAKPPKPKGNPALGCLVLIFFFMILVFSSCAVASMSSDDEDTDVTISAPVSVDPSLEADTKFSPPPVNYDENDPYERDLKILQYSGNPESRQRPLTLSEGKELLDRLSQVHPDLYKVRELNDVRSTCGDMILEPVSEEKLIERTMYRFGNDADRIISPQQAQEIIAIIKDVGSCELNQNYTGPLEMPGS